MTTRRLAALAAAISLALCSAPPAGADPTTDPTVQATPEPAAERPTVDASTTLSLTDLGGSGTIAFGRFNRDNAVASLTFPVPAGLAPVALRATVELPVNLRFGNVSVNQGDRTLGRVGLPPQDGAEIVIPLTGVQVAGNFATITLRMVALALDPYCWDNEAPIRLANLAVAFNGAETPPRSVAEFLPPVLRTAVIAVPAQPSAAESTAAIRVATAVAGRNGQKIDVRIVPLPEGKSSVDLPPGPLVREIVVREGADKGLSLQTGTTVPTLRVSGTGDDLAAQAGLLSNDMVRFAAGSASSSGPLLEDQVLGAEATLEDMGNAGPTGQSSVAFDINQTRFGKPVRDIRVHLIGSYTPLPATFGGEVTVGVGGQTLDRWAVTPDGVIDKWVTIPDALVARLVTVQVGIRTAGEQGDCNRFTAAVRLDKHTELQVASANPAVPQGFQSLPQALMPIIQIGIGADAFADTVRAAQIMVGLQRVSAIPLNSRVTSVAEALASRGSAILIASQGWTDNSVLLPFSINGSDVTVAGEDPGGKSVTLNLTPISRFGSLQTVLDGSRVLMVATSNGAPAQLDQLLAWLGAERGRWSDLNGQAIISVPNAEPITVPNPPVASVSSAVADRANHTSTSWWALGGAAALAAVLALGLLRRRSR